jgi:hypothetical protein
MFTFFATSCNVLKSMADMLGIDTQQDRRKPSTAPKGIYTLFKT